MDDEEKLREAKKVLEKILGGGGQKFSFGNLLGGLNIKTGGLLGGSTASRPGMISSIPPITSTGRSPRDRRRPVKKPVSSSSWQSKAQTTKREEPKEKVDFEEVKKWVIQELVFLFELKTGNKKIDIEPKKQWLLSFIPEPFIGEIISKAQKIASLGEE